MADVSPPLDDYSRPVSTRATRLAKVFTLRERAKREKPGRTVSVVWDERWPLVNGFVSRYCYVVRFGGRGDIAGNHYHKSKQEIYYALHGAFSVILEDVATNTREELKLEAGNNQFIYVAANIAHVVVARTGDAILLVTASRPETPEDEFPYPLV